MPNCKKCGEYFPYRVKIDGKEHNLNGRVYCLNCSPFGMHNTRQLERYPKNPKEGIGRLCPKCNRFLPYGEFYRRKRKTKGGEKRHQGYTSYCRDCMYKLSKAHWNKMKRKAIEYLGGGCVICGYDKYLVALQFHHVNVEEKENGWHVLKKLGWKEIKRELDKCVCICANCHSVVHSRSGKEVNERIQKIFNAAPW